MFTNPNENLNSKSSWKSEHRLSQLRRYKTSKLCRGKTFIIFGRCSGGIREDIRSKNEDKVKWLTLAFRKLPLI